MLDLELLEPRRKAAPSSTSQPRPTTAGPPVEVGWLLVGRLDAVDRGAVPDAHRRVGELLRDLFPEYDWCTPIVSQPDYPRQRREEPARLLEHGVDERDARGWDLVIVITASDLASHYRPRAWATPSRALGVAVISTARIDPSAAQGDAGEAERCRKVAQRLFALVLHSIGHLVGAEHREDCAMRQPEAVTDLDAVTGYSAAAHIEMTDELQRIADRRLEEEPRRPRVFAFYVSATLLNWRNVLHAIRHARPWLLPLRLSRLTTAALSIIFVLATTGEIWEIAGHNGLPTLALLGAAALASTGVFVVKHQRLFLGSARHLAEQTVVTRVSVSCIVILGLVSAFLLLLGLSLALATALFPRAMVASWAGTDSPDLYARVAVLLSSIGLSVGALGASFEDQHYVRHVAYVDEET